MSGGDSINQVGGIGIQSTPPQSFDDGVEQASKPQRMNRSSIESLPATERKVPSSTEKANEFPSLASRKVTHLAPGKFRLLLSKPNKEVNPEKLAGIQKKSQSLDKIFEKLEAKKAGNKAQVKQLVKDFESGLKLAKSNQKQATKQAGAAMLKLSLAEKNGVSVQLSSPEKQALQQMEKATELVGKFESKLDEAKSEKTEFKTVEKIKARFSSRLAKLEKKISEAFSSLNSKLTPSSVGEHKSRVSDLEKKLANVESALKEVKQLGKEVAVAEKKHPGATPKKWEENVKKLEVKAEALRSQGPDVLKNAKAKRNNALELQAERKQTAKQAAIDKREMNKAYNELMKKDRAQDRNIQKKQEELGKKEKRNNVADLRVKEPPKTRRGNLKRSASANDLPSQVTSKSKNTSRPQSFSSGLSGQSSWSKEDQILANRFKKLRDQVAHDPIEPSGKSRTYAQLEKQLNNISSVDDLKAVVADRRSSKINIGYQSQYLGLLKAAVNGMVKNSQFAEQMNEDLIRDVFKEQPEAARAAIKKLQATQVENLERRFERHRSRK